MGPEADSDGGAVAQRSHQQPAAQGRAVDDGSDEFALALYAQLRQRPGNVFFSPVSVRAPLVLLQTGARGETAAQMRDTLRLSHETRPVANGRTIPSVNAGTRGDSVMIANAVWAQAGAPLAPEWVELVAAQGDFAHLKLVDFSHADSARATVNRWVEERTRRKIRELIPPGGVDALTRLLVVNAVYFKANWLFPFERSATRVEPFHADGHTAHVPLMHQRAVTPYLRGPDYQAVDLIYAGGELSMLILLPDRPDGLRDLDQTMSMRMLRECVTRMRVQEIDMFVPRFTITWGTIDVGDALRALGMTLPFDRSRANFSGINGYEASTEEALVLSRLFHQAFVVVNEWGTEAGAATAAPMLLGGTHMLPIPVFRADHPFVFAIRDRKSGALLFLGRMTEPSV